MAAVAVLVYDGDCGFCTSSASWLQRRARGIDLVAWQDADLEGLGLTAAECATAVQLVTTSGRLSGGQAVAAALRRCRQPYRAIGSVLGMRVLRPVVEWGYCRVAANRHRLPGSTCAVSDRDERPGAGPLRQGAAPSVAPADG